MKQQNPNISSLTWNSIKSPNQIDGNEENKTLFKKNQIFFLDKALQKHSSKQFIKDFLQQREDFQTITNIIRVKFKKSITKKQRRKLIQKKQNILSKDIWIINCWNKYKYSWLDLLLSIEKAYCTQLIMFKCWSKNLYVNVISPSYVSLTYLNLSNNRITNIEGLSFIDAPKLRRICLINNEITSFQPMIKFYCRLLSTLELAINFNTFLELSRHYISSNATQYQPKCQNVIQVWDIQKFYDLRRLAKIERGNCVRHYHWKMVNVISQKQQPLFNKGRRIYLSDNIVNALVHKWGNKLSYQMSNYGRLQI